MFSAVMTWGLLDKLAKQRESADAYQALSSEAVVTGATSFVKVTVAPADAAPFEEEAEDQSDTVFFVNNDVATLVAGLKPSPTAAATIAPLGPVTTPSVTPFQSATAGTPTPWATLATATGSVTPMEAVATPAPTTVPAVSATPAPQAAATEAPASGRVVTMSDVRYSVDFGYLQGINEDVQAWLVQDGTPINYPVVQGKNNDYYLDKLFNKKPNKDGSIFLDSGSSPYFIDANTYIYGHHTKTDSMFSTLANYREQSYYEVHPQMVLLTPYGDYCVDLFAARVSAVADESVWRVKQFTRKAEFNEYLAGLNAESLFTGHADAMPEWGDQLLVLITCTNDEHGMRYAVYGRMRPIVYANAEKVTVTKLEMDQAPTDSGWQNVPGRGEMMVYAQNDQLWTNMRYETRATGKKRVFGDGGCGPTSVAMAVANLVPKERLADIYGYAKSSLGYTFCECSVNQYFCNKLHAQYQIQTPDEYLRYFPLVMANFATGNNLWGLESRGKSPGTNLGFLKKIAYLYKLELSTTYDNDLALEAVQNGALVIASLGRENPLTGGGHYVVLASVDNGYLYLLDPYRQAGYEKNDRQHVVETVAPGVARIKLENVPKLYAATCYILKATPATASANPPTVP